MSSLLLTTSEPGYFEFSNCTKIYSSRDDKYLECAQFLPNNSDACEYLKDLHHTRSYSHYALGVVPLIISIFAFLINVVFLYICRKIIKDQSNPCRKTYLFNFTRSISAIVGLIVYYCILIVWKIGKLEKIPVIIFFTIGSWSFLLQAASYGCMARTLELGCIISFEHYPLIFTMENYLKFYNFIWLFSAMMGVFFGITYIVLEYVVDFTTESVLAVTVLGIAILLSIAHLSLILTNFRMMLVLRKLIQNNEESVRHINTKNNAAVYRLIYVTINCILTKVSLIVLSVFCFDALTDLDEEDDINSTCQRFLQGKAYLKISIFGSIILILVIIGMISDPLVSFLCDFENIKPLLLDHYESWKERLQTGKNGEQEDE